MRWLRRIDHVLEGASGRPLADIDRTLLAPLRIGAFQLLFLERIPPYAAVSEAVREAGRRSHRRGAGFVNGVLRRVAASPSLADWPVELEDPAARLALESSHPELLVRRWLERFGAEQTRAILEASNAVRPPQLLSFRDRGGPQALAASLVAEGVETEPCAIAPLGLTVREGDPLKSEAFRRGDLYVQDQASQAAALVPPPRPGESILDAAAAPGGKSFSIVAREPRARALLADLSPARAALTRRNLIRLGRALPLLVSDARRPALATVFDRVLLDLPCTGTGTLARHPELKWRISSGELERLAEQGLTMLRAAAPLVAAGGLLVAVTCSLEREENEEVAARFLRRQPEFEPRPLEDLLPEPLAAAIAGLGRWRLLPGPDRDGFTVQVLARKR